MALGVVADLLSGYSLDGAGAITTEFSVLSLETLTTFLVSKPTSEVVLGHYIAILGIPLGLFGLWQVYQGIQPAGWALSRTVWFLGVFGYVTGTVFHSTFAFITFGVQATDAAPPAGAQTATRPTSWSTRPAATGSPTTSGSARPSSCCSPW